MIYYLIAATGIWAASLLLYELLLPLISFKVAPASAVILKQTLTATSALRQQTIIAAGNTAGGGNTPAGALLYTYVAGVLVMLCILGRQAAYLITLRRGARLEQHGALTLTYTRGRHSPFSFFRHIYLPADTAYTATELDMVLRHEGAHITAHHTLDVCFLLLCRTGATGS